MESAYAKDAICAVRYLNMNTIGVNFFGSSETSDGIGRAAALNIHCLKATNKPMETFVLSRPVALQTGRNTVIDDALVSNLKHKINIFQFSARWVPHYFSRLSDGALDGFYNIGYWFCEVPQIPDEWARQLEFFDEIWTASSFCQAAFSRAANIPVIRIPLWIEPQEQSARIKARESVFCSEPFTFLTIFNAYSDAERKNALFTIRAFLEAHGTNPAVRLIVKVSNLEHDPILSEKLAYIRSAYTNIEVIDGYVEDRVVRALYDRADAYVSLHRAEGFGLTISDAMARGIPVITTGYSGNMEFCDSYDTRLVGYALRTVGHERLRYRKSDVWAEPDLDDAICAFKELVSEHPKWIQRADRARNRIAEHFSASSVADMMNERIDLIGRNFSFSSDMNKRELDREVGILDTYGF